MRSKKLLTEHGILNAPENFLFIPLVARDSDQLQPPLKKHLVRQTLEFNIAPTRPISTHVVLGG